MPPADVRATLPADAIRFDENKKANITRTPINKRVRYLRTGDPVIWTTDHRPLHERTAEYVKGIVDTKPGRWMYINYVMNVSPQCDCYYWNDAPIVPNIGILASTDPVAIDRASAELINRAAPLPGSKIAGRDESKDNLRALYDLPWEYQLEYASEIGLGENGFDLVEI